MAQPGYRPYTPLLLVLLFVSLVITAITVVVAHDVDFRMSAGFVALTMMFAAGTTRAIVR